MDILIDFDGTCNFHDFPRIGKDIGAVPVLKDLVANGHNLILFTMRSDRKKVDTGSDASLHNEPGDYLTQAVNWFKENDIPLYGIQTNPTQKHWTDSPKAYGHIMIDDSALGTPLCRSMKGERPYVDWEAVRKLLVKQEILRQENYA